MQTLFWEAIQHIRWNVWESNRSSWEAWNQPEVGLMHVNSRETQMLRHWCRQQLTFRTGRTLPLPKKQGKHRERKSQEWMVWQKVFFFQVHDFWFQTFSVLFTGFTCSRVSTLKGQRNLRWAFYRRMNHVFEQCWRSKFTGFWDVCIDWDSRGHSYLFDSTIWHLRNVATPVP